MNDSCIRLLCTLLLLSLGCALSAQENEARTALIVGVDNYTDRNFAPLKAPVADAHALHTKLRSLGFEAELLLNPTRRQLTDAVDSFGSILARRGGIGLFYFSGHGAMKSDESGTNYLIPAGTNIRTENDLPEEAFNAQRVANRMKEAKNRLNLVFLDACRNHSLPRGDGAKSATGGLSEMRGASGLMFFFATQPGEVAIEDTSKRSLFTTALLKHMDRPGLNFMEMMGDVTAETEQTSLTLTERKFRQSPFITGTISGRFYFNPSALNPPPQASHSSARDPIVTASKEAPFVNSLGMEFVPVPGTNVLMCRTETRVDDFRRYVQDSEYRQTGGAEVLKVKGSSSKSYSFDWVRDTDTTWEDPGFSQGGDHPVTCVSWEEARAFCAWLSKKEGRAYRLPTDAEWSAAAGLGKYPWGSTWPPPAGAGNFFDEAATKNLPGKKWIIIAKGYNDGAPRTAAVASYTENRLGIYDLAGNVWEWCEDIYRANMNSSEVLSAFPDLKAEAAKDGSTFRVMRGGSWYNNTELNLRSTNRNNDHPSYRDSISGFRCILETTGG